MNILKDLSKKDLKLNKKRSIVIIIGIILSTALICGVAGIVTSFQDTLIKFAKERDGNYHVQFYNVPEEELKYIEENRSVKDYYVSEDIGYSYLKESQNENKPYIYVKAMDEKYLNNMGISLIEGRLPENSNEIIISNHIKTNGKVDYKIGDEITLNVGRRQLKDGTTLEQENPYQSGKEEIVDTDRKTYTIVGIIERLTSRNESYTAPGYTVITKLEKVKDKANIAVLYTKVKNYQKYTEQINDMKKLGEGEKDPNAVQFYGMRDALYKSYKYDISLNRDLLAYEGANLSDGTLEMLYTLGAIVMVIILVSSVFVIRNGFAISITERLKQYGMLSSIGATKKQIKKSVYFEGFVLGIIAIPLGILSGVFAISILLKLVNYILKDYVEGLELMYSISWSAIILSILIAAITIWLSCKGSARKASKVTPIEAIRNTNEVKLKAKKVRCPKIITKIFKTGGEIAYKNLKRSKKKYRTTVISIIVSVVIFISISSFIEYGFKMTNVYYTDYGYNIRVTDRDELDQEESYKRLLEITQLKGIDEYSIQRRESVDLENKNSLSDFGKKVYQYEDNLTIMMISLGNEEYQRFLKDIGGKYEEYKDKAILLDDCIMYDEEGKAQKGNLYIWKKGDIVTGKTTDEGNLSIEIAKKTDKKPMGLEKLNSYSAYLVVSDEYMDKFEKYSLGSLLINTKKSEEVEERINQYYKNLNLQNNDSISVYNVDEGVKENNAIILVVSIFLYGFITVITLIGVTNIFNTITTNMNLRKKEFAMLKSIGMTKKEFNRMIRLESIFYGSKALIIGLPIGIGLSYFIYKVFDTNIGMGYVPPYKAIIVAIIFVALVVGIIMKYSMSKINKQNIIETIRNDNI